MQSLSSLKVHNNLRETTAKEAEIWSSASVSFSSPLYFTLFCVCVEGGNPSWLPGAFLPGLDIISKYYCTPTGFHTQGNLMQAHFSWFLFLLVNVLHSYYEMVSSEILFFRIPFMGYNIPPNLEMWACLYISHFLTVLAVFPEREEKPYKISVGPQSRNICRSHE